MKCIVCHGEDIRIREVNEDIHVGADIVHVPVKTQVCMTCGERYYDRKTIRLLEDIETKLSRTELKLKEVGKVLVCDEAISVA